MQRQDRCRYWPLQQTQLQAASPGQVQRGGQAVLQVQEGTAKFTLPQLLLPSPQLHDSPLLGLLLEDNAQHLLLQQEAQSLRAEGEANSHLHSLPEQAANSVQMQQANVSQEDYYLHSVCEKVPLPVQTASEFLCVLLPQATNNWTPMRARQNSCVANSFLETEKRQVSATRAQNESPRSLPLRHCAATCAEMQQSDMQTASSEKISATEALPLSANLAANNSRLLLPSRCAALDPLREKHAGCSVHCHSHTHQKEALQVEKGAARFVRHRQMQIAYSRWPLQLSLPRPHRHHPREAAAILSLRDCAYHQEQGFVQMSTNTHNQRQL